MHNASYFVLSFCAGVCCRRTEQPERECIKHLSRVVEGALRSLGAEMSVLRVRACRWFCLYWLL